MKVIHLIPSLDIGGAELMLKRLVLNKIRSDITHEIICIKSLKEIPAELSIKNIKVQSLGYKSIFSLPITLLKLNKVINTNTQALFQSWMYHSNLIISIMSIFKNNVKIIWNIRGNHIPQSFLSLTSFIVFLGAKLSYFSPLKIICCGNSVKESHIKKGFNPKLMTVIQNGYEVEKYIPNDCRAEVREKLGIESKIVIGLVGRYDPLKNYPLFIKAISKIKDTSNLHFLLVGKNLDSNNKELNVLLKKHNLNSRFTLLGELQNPVNYIDAFDFFCSSSSSEGFPNVVCEAMLMEKICIVTDAGDSREIVDNTGFVVPINDHKTLCKAIEKCINLPSIKRDSLSKEARNRIINHYSIHSIAKHYENLYTSLL